MLRVVIDAFFFVYGKNGLEKRIAFATSQILLYPLRTLESPLAYNITYKESVAKDLKRIDKQSAKRILDKIDEELAEDPERFPNPTGPFAGLRKFRVGDYRVIFVIVNDEILILRVQHRKDVYRG